MNTAPAGEATRTAPSEGKRNASVRQGFWTIGRKIAGIVATMVITGIAGMTVISANTQQKDLRMMSQETGVTVTGMLSGAVSGGVRWKKADRIEAAWTDLVKEEGSTIVDIVVWDTDDAALAKYRSDKWDPVDLANFRAKWSSRLDAGKMAVMVHENHLIVAAPVVTGADNIRIGTLAVAWTR